MPRPAAALGPDRGRRRRRRSACSSCVWMIIPSLATAQGWPARMARGSAIVAAIERLGARRSRRSFAAWGRSISDAPYPVGARPARTTPPNPGPPPGTSLAGRGRRARARVDREGAAGARATRSRRGAAGSRRRASSSRTRTSSRASARPTVRGRDGRRRSPATVVAFDPVRDLAVLDVPGARPRAPLPLATGRGRRRRRGLRPPRRRRRCARHRRGSATRSSRSAPTSTAPDRAAGTCSCSRRRSRPATPAARSSNAQGDVDRHGVRDRPRPRRDGLRAHRRGDPTRARARPRRRTGRHRRCLRRRRRRACVTVPDDRAGAG